MTYASPREWNALEITGAVALALAAVAVLTAMVAPHAAAAAAGGALAALGMKLLILVAAGQ